MFVCCIRIIKFCFSSGRRDTALKLLKNSNSINRQQNLTTTSPLTTESFTKLITEGRSSLSFDEFIPPATVTTTYTSSTTSSKNIYDSNEDFTHDLDEIDNDDVDNEELINEEDDDDIRYNYDNNAKDLPRSKLKMILQFEPTFIHSN